MIDMMIWGCIFTKGVGNMIVVYGIINQDQHLKTLKENLKQLTKKRTTIRSTRPIK